MTSTPKALCYGTRGTKSRQRSPLCKRSLGKRVRVGQGSGTVLHWENFLPKEFAPLLVLDASSRHRSLYSVWFKGRGDLKYLYSPGKTYRNLTIHFMKKPSGREAYLPMPPKTRKDWNWKHIVHEVDKVVKAIPENDQALVIHIKPDPVYVIDFEEQLRRAQVEEELPPEMLKSELPAVPGTAFLTYGMHSGTNIHRDAKHVIVTNVHRFAAPQIEALGRGAAGIQATDRFSDEQYKQTDLGEVAHNLYQAVSRSNIRFCVEGDCPPGCHVWIMYSTHGVIPGSNHTQALGISSPRIDEVHLMGPCNHGEPQWSSMSDWMSHLR
jgi:hypothetical protein